MRRDAFKPFLIVPPVLAGQFLYDLTSKGLARALHEVPMRLLLLVAVVSLWSLAVWAWRRRKRTFR